MEKPQIKTYIATALELFDRNPPAHSELQRNAILSFAKYLDAGNNISIELQLAAVQQYNKLQEEIILELVNKLGKDEATKIIKEVADRHKHKPKDYEQPAK
jgi:hypothetical protein